MQFRKRHYTTFSLLATTMFGMSLLFGGGSANAAESKNVVIKKDKEELTLQLKEKGDYFKYFKDGELVYQGKSKKFNDTLDEAIQNYRIGIYNDNELTDVINVKIPNNSESNSVTELKRKDINADLMEKKINASNLYVISTDSSTQLNWGDLPDKDSTYEIIKNGVKIAETKDNNFTDFNVNPGERNDYEVKVAIDVSEDKRKEYEQEINAKKIKLSKEERVEVFTVNGSLSSLVDVPEKTEEYLDQPQFLFENEKQSYLSSNKKQEGTVSKLAIPKSNAYTFQYTTFIPFKSVEDPKPFNGTYLKGDNRSYDPYSDKFRTRVSVNTGFVGPTYLTPYVKIGTSHRCSDAACTKIIETKTASSSGVEVLKDTVGSTKMQWRVKHDVGIPFGAEYPNINYYYEATLTNKQSFVVKGAHDNAPNHEFVLFSETSTNYINLHRYAVGSTWDFLFLAPATPQEFFNKTF